MNLSDSVKIAIIGNVAMLIGLVLSRLSSHLEHKRTEKQSKENAEGISEIRFIVNGRMEDLLKAVKSSSRAEGVEMERQRQKE